jgi:hypothetical protein
MLPLTDVYWIIRERVVKMVSHPAPERVPMVLYAVDKGQRARKEVLENILSDVGVLY